MRPTTLGLFAACSLACAAPALSSSAQNYVDTRGKEWLQVNRFLNTSWNQIAAICPTDGVTPCSGSIAGTDLTGWVWASQSDVRTLMSYWVPEILTTDAVGGSAYVLQALTFLEAIRPTWQYYTTFGGYLYTAGWTSTQNEDGTAILAAASGQYPVFDGAFSVAGANLPTYSSNTLGAWFWRSTVAEPCPADLNGDTAADILDFLLFIDAFGACENQPAGCTLDGLDPNLVADDTVDILDFLEFMDRFGNGCEP